MIPLRVYLQNFLCYAEQEFVFEDHPVWLLHGPNGVGKSAVFDAMVYALYAESRRSDSSKNAVADIIRHGAYSMRVEFDFEISGQRYQVWRTRHRGGQPKQGVNQWVPRPANGQSPKPEPPAKVLTGVFTPIRNIHSARDLSEWVATTLGLTYDAFVASVLLRQGAAEKLIDAEKSTRRELFRSFINLDPYIELHDRVKEARANRAADLRQFRAQLNVMPVISDASIADKTAVAQAAEEELHNAKRQKSPPEKGSAMPAPEALEASRKSIQSVLDSAAIRTIQATELERQVGRLKELRVLVPGLSSR